MDGINKELLAACKATYDLLMFPWCYTDQDYWDLREMLKGVIEKAERGSGEDSRQVDLST